MNFSGNAVEGVDGWSVGVYQWCQQRPGRSLHHHRHTAEWAVTLELKRTHPFRDPWPFDDDPQPSEMKE